MKLNNDEFKRLKKIAEDVGRINPEYSILEEAGWVLDRYAGFDPDVINLRNQVQRLRDEKKNA